MHNEVYGLDPDFTCEAEQVAIGESTRCTVAFVAPTAEMTDFSWWNNGQNVAAWPSQTVG